MLSDSFAGVESLAYVGFESPAAKEWQTFGPEVLGAELVDGDDHTVRLRLDDHAWRIAVHTGPLDRLAYLGWSVKGPDALARISERLIAAGVKVEDGTPGELAGRQVQAMAWFEDPAGLRHEVTWGQRVRPSSFRPGRPISGFVTDGGGLGHLVLVVPDRDSEERFITELLGLRLSDQVDMGPVGLRFYRCNQRHHSLALVPVPGMVGVHHLMVEVGSIDDVGTGLELVERRGMLVALSLGRHTNDLMTSFYVRSPSGFEVEYGTGGLLVDETAWEGASYEAISVWGHHPLVGLAPGSAVTQHEGARS